MPRHTSAPNNNSLPLRPAHPYNRTMTISANHHIFIKQIGPHLIEVENRQYDGAVQRSARIEFRVASPVEWRRMESNDRLRNEVAARRIVETARREAERSLYSQARDVQQQIDQVNTARRSRWDNPRRLRRSASPAPPYQPPAARPATPIPIPPPVTSGTVRLPTPAPVATAPPSGPVVPPMPAMYALTSVTAEGELVGPLEEVDIIAARYFGSSASSTTRPELRSLYLSILLKQLDLSASARSICNIRQHRKIRRLSHALRYGLKLLYSGTLLTSFSVANRHRPLAAISSALRLKLEIMKSSLDWP